MKLVSNLVLKALGVLLLVAAVLKGWQLLTEPVVNKDIWTYRPFLVLTVEFELAFGIWLLSGLLKKAAWLAGVLCFSAFSMVTLYKGITGAESCGCFGRVHVNPWVTLFAIDLPAVLLLCIFRPKDEKLFLWPPLPRMVIVTAAAVLVLGVTAPILALSKPASTTASYEVLEPETWVGKKLPILEYIDIADQLVSGVWLVLLYHYDCPDCARAIAMYENIVRDLAGGEEILRIAFIEVPPYGQGPVSADTPCAVGRLADVKEWFVTTPAVALLSNGQTKRAWESQAPDFETVMQSTDIVDGNANRSGDN